MLLSYQRSVVKMHREVQQCTTKSSEEEDDERAEMEVNNAGFNMGSELACNIMSDLKDAHSACSWSALKKTPRCTFDYITTPTRSKTISNKQQMPDDPSFLLLLELKVLVEAVKMVALMIQRGI